MSTEAQITANRENATHSTGPITPEGKATASQNRLSHGLSGTFRVLGGEDSDQFENLIKTVYAEHKPTTATETRIVESIAQHFWLMQRALTLQDRVLANPDLDHKTFALYLRYQTTNERAYYRAIRELATLRKEARREQIGFESQKRRVERHEHWQICEIARLGIQDLHFHRVESDAILRKVAIEMAQKAGYAACFSA